MPQLKKEINEYLSLYINLKQHKLHMKRQKKERKRKGEGGRNKAGKRKRRKAKKWTRISLSQLISVSESLKDVCSSESMEKV